MTNPEVTESIVINKEELIKRIQERKNILKNAEKELKKHFVGIDKEIEYVIKSIQTWYIAPELSTRPVIVCLWGPTGVGKTDLVRRLVKLLGFKDKYCEIEMGNQTSSWSKSVSSLLRGHANIESGKPSVLLLDEIQRFRTVDEQGCDILDYEMKDVWTLLSDGKLPFKAEIDSLMSMLWDYNKPSLIQQHRNVGVPVISKMGKGTGKTFKHLVGKSQSGVIGGTPDEPEEESEEEKLEKKYNYYTLNYYKELLRLDDPIEEIATWSEEKKHQVIIQRMKDKSIYDEEDYTKMLIFISGNLDEAYGFTKDAKEVDIDADILYDISKKISILDIKGALSKRFRPEQISRMGNTHVIYPSLNRASFESIIERKINKIIEDIKTKTDINLSVDSSIRKLIYDNGVFPTQGTRPVFSTISEILEASLPDFILKALVTSNDDICLKYENKKIIAEIGNISCSKKYSGTLDKLREINRNSSDTRALAAVHEAAHAVIHAVMFNMVPHQIVATPVSSEMEGFVYSQNTALSKDMIHKRIRVLLAGKEAEKLVFGEMNQTSGAFSDLRKATHLATNMVRSYAMSEWTSLIDHHQRDGDVNHDVQKTNQIIEDIIHNETLITAELLKTYKALLIDTIEPLTKQDKIDPKLFRDICKKHGVKAGLSKSSEDVIGWQYSVKLNEFKKTEKSS